MKNRKVTIYAENGKNGLDIYLDISGTTHYLTTRRTNGLLYHWLKDGKTISELSRVKPQYSRTGQKKYHYAQYLIKFTEGYIKYNIAK